VEQKWDAQEKIPAGLRSFGSRCRVVEDSAASEGISLTSTGAGRLAAADDRVALEDLDTNLCSELFSSKKLECCTYMTLWPYIVRFPIAKIMFVG